MEWLYLMKWSYKKFLYLRLELFLILNEWLRKRPFRVWDVSPTYWAPQPLAFHVITYIKIRTVSVCVFVDVDAVSFTIDGGCDGRLAWDMVAC